MNGTPSGSATFRAPSVRRAYARRVSLVGRSAAMNSIKSVASTVAPRQCTVMVLGETSASKEMVARYIHAQSDRCDAPLIPVDCSARSIVDGAAGGPRPPGWLCRTFLKPFAASSGPRGGTAALLRVDASRGMLLPSLGGDALGRLSRCVFASCAVTRRWEGCFNLHRSKQPSLSQGLLGGNNLASVGSRTTGYNDRPVFFEADPQNERSRLRNALVFSAFIAADDLSRTIGTQFALEERTEMRLLYSGFLTEFVLHDYLRSTHAPSHRDRRLALISGGSWLRAR